MLNLIQHDPDACNGCGLCARTCPQLVFEQAARKVAPRIAHPERCFGCLACEEDCARDALRVHRLPEGLQADALPVPGAGLDPDRRYDLLVIGAGPAGMGAAISARRLGLDVAVLERLPSPRRSHHPDGGAIFSPPELYTLQAAAGGFLIEELDLEFERDVVQEWIKDFALVGPSGQRTRARADDWPGFPLVSKDLFVNRLITRASELGAVIAFNTRARSISAPAADGDRRVEIDGGVQLRARVVISAEGIAGRLTHAAGLAVNAKRFAWCYAPYLDYAPIESQSSTAGFLVYDGPGKEDGEPLPYLAYGSSGPAAVHVAASPMHRKKPWQLGLPATAIAARYAQEDHHLHALLGGRPGPEPERIDGCRVLARAIPDTFVQRGLIAAGDTITTCGMMTNVLAIKSGDLAARVAKAALARDDTSAQALATFDRRMRKLQMFTGMSWMNNMLIRAPMELSARRLDKLFDKHTSLVLGRMMAGEVWPMVSFYLRQLPTLLTDSGLRSYMLP